MSPKATRVSGDARIQRFEYLASEAPGAVVTAPGPTRTVQRVASAGGAPVHTGIPLASAFSPSISRAEVSASAMPDEDDGREREAFAQGYAQGERAGIDVAARQLQAVHGRLGQTIDQLLSLREELTYRTERQVVELALAMAARILHREVSLDRELLLVMARLAIDRMGDGITATIRLHPDDEAAARGERDSWPGGSVAIVADASIRPGGCVVQTEQGQVEVGVDAQLKELATAILGDLPLVAPMPATRVA